MDSMMAGMGLGALVLIAAVVAVLVLAVLGSIGLARRLGAGGRGDGVVGAANAVQPSDPAREELRRRYAAGEIDDEEFERRLAALTWR